MSKRFQMNFSARLQIKNDIKLRHDKRLTLKNFPIAWKQAVGNSSEYNYSVIQ